MIFAHDTEASLQAMVDLVNTEARCSHSGEDELANLDHLDAFIERHQYTGSFTRTAGELETVRELRPEFRQFWSADRDESVEIINAMLRQGHALPQLVRHDGWDWHLHATHPDAPFAVRVRVESAMAMIDVVRAGEDERLRRCAADDCDAVFIDFSRNRSKRYCDVGNCGNRMNVTAYRARRAAGA